MKKHINNGFTLIEALFSLFITSLGISLMVSIFPLLSKINQYDNDLDEEISLAQLRETVLFGYDFIFDPTDLRFYYQGVDISIIIDGDRIVRHDGYVIYMEGIQDAYFSEKDECFYLNYEKDNEFKERFLGCR